MAENGKDKVGFLGYAVPVGAFAVAVGLAFLNYFMTGDHGDHLPSTGTGPDHPPTPPGGGDHPAGNAGANHPAGGKTETPPPADTPPANNGGETKPAAGPTDPVTEGGKDGQPVAQDKPAEKPAEQPAEKPAEKPANPPQTDQKAPAEGETKQPTKPPNPAPEGVKDGQPVAQDKPVEKPAEQPAEKPAEKPANPPQTDQKAPAETPKPAEAPKPTETPNPETPKVSVDMHPKDGQGLIATTRDGFEDMAKTDAGKAQLTAIENSTQDPNLKAACEAAKQGDHKSLTTALEKLYTKTGDYAPNATDGKDSTILGRNDAVRIDDKGLHIIRNVGTPAETDVLIEKTDGTVVRPADTPMKHTGPIATATKAAPAPAAPAPAPAPTSTTPATDGSAATATVTPTDDDKAEATDGVVDATVAQTTKKSN